MPTVGLITSILLIPYLFFACLSRFAALKRVDTKILAVMLRPFLPIEMQPDVPDYDGGHQKRYDHVKDHIDRE